MNTAVSVASVASALPVAAPAMPVAQIEMKLEELYTQWRTATQEDNRLGIESHRRANEVIGGGPPNSYLTLEDLDLWILELRRAEEANGRLAAGDRLNHIDGMLAEVIEDIWKMPAGSHEYLRAKTIAAIQANSHLFATKFDDLDWHERAVRSLIEANVATCGLSSLLDCTIEAEELLNDKPELTDAQAALISDRADERADVPIFLMRDELLQARKAFCSETISLNAVVNDETADEATAANAAAAWTAKMQSLMEIHLRLLKRKAFTIKGLDAKADSARAEEIKALASPRPKTSLKDACDLAKHWMNVAGFLASDIAMWAHANSELESATGSDAELKGLWAKWVDCFEAHELARSRQQAARAAMDAEMPPCPEDILPGNHWTEQKDLRQQKHGYDQLYDAWCKTGERVSEVSEEILELNAESLFGIGAKLVSIPHRFGGDPAKEDYEDAIRSALTDIDRLVGTDFSASFPKSDDPEDENEDDDAEDEGDELEADLDHEPADEAA